MSLKKNFHVWCIHINYYIMSNQYNKFTSFCTKVHFYVNIYWFLLKFRQIYISIKCTFEIHLMGHSQIINSCQRMTSSWFIDAMYIYELGMAGNCICISFPLYEWTWIPNCCMRQKHACLHARCQAEGSKKGILLLTAATEVCYS